MIMACPINDYDDQRRLTKKIKKEMDEVELKIDFEDYITRLTDQVRNLVKPE